MVEEWFHFPDRFRKDNLGYVFYRVPGPGEHQFLCSNWAGWRLTGKIEYGMKLSPEMIKEAPLDTPGNTVDAVKRMAALVGPMGLQNQKDKTKWIVSPCDANDPEKVRATRQHLP